MASWLALLSWGELGIVLVLLVLGLATKQQELGTPFLSALAVLVITVAIYILTALPLKCVQCNRRLMFETVGLKSPNAAKRRYLDHWASAVIDVAFRRRLVCMYCGTEHRVSVR